MSASSSFTSSPERSSPSTSQQQPYKPMFTKQQEWKNTGSEDYPIPVFYPTMEEFSDFGKYIEHIERQNAHMVAGICKIVPPKGWHPRPSKPAGNYSDLDNFIIETPVKERIECVSAGCYVKNNAVYRKEMRVQDFRRMAQSSQYRTPKKDYDLVELERHFWRNLLHHEPIYGADTPGSIYDKDVQEFNMNSLCTILDLLKELGVTIKGVNTVFLYFGMWKTMFPWHAEDMDLYSINYLHFGEPKFWYAIPPIYAERFERLAAQRFPDGLQICKAFLRHKLYIISPTVLKQNGIPYGTMVQYPGEFMITFPKGYHMGFNVGYNCAESTNFALERWIDFGKNTVLCYCRKDTVEIDMRPFMQKYRPEEYKEWFDYWYGERPSSYKPKQPGSLIAAARRRRSKGSGESENGSKSGGSSRASPAGEVAPRAASSEDSLPDVPRSISFCTKRQKKIFHARKPVNDLWATRPVNLFAEKQHNQRCGRLFPHCTVCQYFVSREIWSRGTAVEKIPESSRRYVTDQMFHKEHALEDMDWTIREDDLLQCANCLVVVHKNCYPCGGKKRTDSAEKESKAGTSKTDEVTAQQSGENWLCERCFDRNDTLIRSTSCKLCELRGGALVETQQNSGKGNDFVHVICALMDRQTRFLQPRDRRAPFSPPPRKMCPPSWTTLDHDYLLIAPGQSPRQQQQLVQPELGIFNESTITQSNDNEPLTQNSPSTSTSATPKPAVQIATGHRCSPAILKRQKSGEEIQPQPNPSSTFAMAAASSSSPQPIPTAATAAADEEMACPCRDLMVQFGMKKRSSVASSSSSKGSQVPVEYPASYQCEVCGQQADAETLIRCDICVSLEDMGAKLRFHITCAPLADLTFERRHFPECAVPICSFHQDQGSLAEDPALLDPRVFSPNQKVVVHIEEEQLTGYARILSITEHLYATVDFLDGSISDDVFSCDIRNCECKWFAAGCGTTGVHVPGALVYVQWSDGKIYEAYYRGRIPKKKFKVKMLPPHQQKGSKSGEDFVEIDSESIFRHDEVLPERIRQALLKRESTERLP